jgi:hypothetical protein
MDFDCVIYQELDNWEDLDVGAKIISWMLKRLDGILWDWFGMDCMELSQDTV